MLTPKQQRFVEEYLIDLNATAAAKRAGYSAKTAEWQGPQLLGKTHVAAAVQQARAKVSERTARTVDAVIADIRRIGDMAEASEEWGAALKARELEGKHLGAFTERVEVKGEIRSSLNVTGLSTEALAEIMRAKDAAERG